MHAHHLTDRHSHRLLIGILIAIVLMLLTSRAAARQNIRQAFFAVYPNAVGSPLDTVPSHATHCGVCHYNFSGGGARNPYGTRIGQIIGNFPNTDAGRQQAILSVQYEDSDLDGYSTLIEVTDTVTYGNTPTFPGLTSFNVSLVTGVSLADIQNHLVPVLAPDVTPPVVDVLSPNGGETVVGNGSFTVTWTATDPSGVIWVDLYLSEDGGATYRPVAYYLENTGTYLWFAANRPTANARFRVFAWDGYLNGGFDDSDNQFIINAPPGGLVPSTLRDFDQPGTQPLEGGVITNPTGNCGACHGGYNPAVEPYFNWQGSMMAHASIDPLFEACMAVANQDAPDSGDLCLRCHLPNGWLAGRSIPTNGSQMIASDRVGVSCDLCHRMVDPIYSAENPIEDQSILAALTMPPTGFGNGMYVIDPSGERRGPFSDADLAHPALYSPFHRDAALCGTCHDVSNPAFEKDAAGNYVPNPFNSMATSFSAHTLMPMERTYSEWLNSAYNSPQGVYAPQFGGNREYVSICQDCHMRAVTGQGCGIPGAPVRDNLPLHDMTGGSTWMTGLLATLYPNEVNAAAAQAGIVRARYMLQQAATMTADRVGSQLKVTVVNESGHKLPTGYPEGRRIWINVKFLDAASNVVGESGAYDAATGILTVDAQAKVYEAKPGLDEVTAPIVGVPPGPSFHFVLNNKIFKDNRIPPRGFTNAGFAQFGGAPVGHAYADDQYWDETLYALPAGAVTAQVRLYYQSTSKEYIEFLRDANTTNDRGQFLHNAWSSSGKAPPEEMAVVNLSLLLAGDIDGNGVRDMTDVELFAAVLVDQETNPDYIARSDVNHDSARNGLDVGPFVDAILE